MKFSQLARLLKNVTEKKNVTEVDEYFQNQKRALFSLGCHKQDTIVNAHYIGKAKPCPFSPGSFALLDLLLLAAIVVG